MIKKIKLVSSQEEDLKKTAKSYMKKIGDSKKKALAALVKAGILTKTGKLHKNYR